MEIKNLFDDKFEFLERSAQVILVSKFGVRLPPKKLKYFCALYLNHLEGIRHLSKDSLIRLRVYLGKPDLLISDISNYIGILSREGYIKYDKQSQEVKFSNEFKKIRVANGKLVFNVKIEYRETESTTY